MNLISAELLTKSFGTRILFQNISFGINQGQKTGLIAKNGTGKSTLLKILSSQEQPDSGKITFRNGIEIGYMDQNENFDPEHTILEIILLGNPELVKTISDYEYFINLDQDKQEPVKLQEIYDRMERLNGWDIESRIIQVTEKLDLPNIQTKTKILSGGQLKRLSLAAILAKEPDVFILDEPTNHLDIEMTEWLEGYLSKQNISLIMVTHDRYFLDRVCNEIIELDGGKIYSYKGDYEYFLEKKEERELSESSEIDKAKNLFRRELEWIRKMPKARGTKAKYRVNAFEGTKEKASRKVSGQKMELQVTTQRIGGKILEVTNLSMSFGEKKLFKNFSHVFQRNEKIGIIGKNGSGKSTFLNILMQLLTPDTGTISKGETISIGYYSQKRQEFKQDQRVIDVVKDHAEIINLQDGSTITASQLLQMFLFPPALQHSFVSKLSGGELKRLQLLTVLIKNPNFLILDEPTNDLDLVTLNVLEDFLFKFKGCVIIVTHDRYFLDKIVDHLFVFENEEISIFPGNYTEFREEIKLKEKIDQRNLVVALNKTNPGKPEANKTGLSFKEKQEIESLEEEIEGLERKKKELTGKLNSRIIDHQQLFGISSEIKEVEMVIETKTIRWSELLEKC